jgi:hypothetical protein
MFMRDKPIPSKEIILCKGYNHKGLVAKKPLVVSLMGLGAKMNRLAVNRQE